MATLKYVEDVFEYFINLIDEPDTNGVTLTEVQQFLEIGHDHYYQYITDIQPETFVKSHTFSLANVREYDLDGILLGPAAPDATRMLQLVRLVKVNSDGTVSEIFEGVENVEQLISYTEGTPFYLHAKKIRFEAETDGDFRLDYIAVPTVNWANTAPTSNEWIDDLLTFHDLIALFAAQQYFAIDNQPNPMTDRLLMLRQKAFEAHVERGRNLESSRFYHDENPYW